MARPDPRRSRPVPRRGRTRLFPAWETLPFERVSPNVETMGQRLDVLWRLRDPDRMPKVIVAGVRGAPPEARPRSARGRAGGRPPRQRGRPRSARRDSSSDSATGAKKSSSTAASSPEAVRSSTCTRRRRCSDPHRPVGRRGRPADPFSVNDQRSSVDLAEAWIFPARELTPTPRRSASAAAGFVETEPWGREQWERLSEGNHFDGMESWLPWLVDTDGAS